MSGYEQAQRAMKGLVHRTVKVPTFTGMVKAVNTGKFTCDVDPNDGGATHFDVRLKVAVNGNDQGAFSVPKVGSQVLVAMLEGATNNLCVIAVETIEEHVIRVDGNGEVRVKPNGVVAINGDQYGGLVKVQELRTELQKVTTFMETLRNTINSAPAAGDVTPFKGALTSALSGLQLPTYTQIESDKTKHGSL